MKFITQEVLNRKIQIDDNITLVHVTKSKKGHQHPFGFSDISFYLLKKKAEKIFPDKEQNIIVFSEEEKDAENAVKYLEHLGYKNVVDLEPSINEMEIE